MAALTLLSRSAQRAPIDLDLWMIVEAQGAEDKQLRENARIAVAHWRSRAEYLLGREAIAEDVVSVPFAPVKKVRVTYRHVGRLKPLPYPLDE